MSRKRKNPPDHNTFYIDQNDVADRDAVAVVERVQGSRIIRQTTVLAAPEPLAPIQPAFRDFDDIRAVLGDAPEIQDLENSEEVIQQYIQAPGERRKGKKTAGQYATTVRVFCSTQRYSRHILTRIYYRSTIRCCKTGSPRAIVKLP